MPVIVLKLFLTAIAVVFALFAGGAAFRSARQLDRRIREFKEEQERADRTGGPIDPYQALGEAFKSRTDPRRRGP